MWWLWVFAVLQFKKWKQKPLSLCTCLSQLQNTLRAFLVFVVVILFWGVVFACLSAGGWRTQRIRLLVLQEEHANIHTHYHRKSCCYVRAGIIINQVHKHAFLALGYKFPRNIRVCISPYHRVCTSSTHNGTNINVKAQVTLNKCTSTFFQQVTYSVS